MLILQLAGAYFRKIQGNFSQPYYRRLNKLARVTQIMCLTKATEYKACTQDRMLVFSEGSDIRMLRANQKSRGICDKSRPQGLRTPFFPNLFSSINKNQKSRVVYDLTSFDREGKDFGDRRFQKTKNYGKNEKPAKKVPIRRLAIYNAHP